MDCGLGRVKGAEEGKHSQASHQGSCRDVPVSLLLMPQDTAVRPAARPLSCHCRVTMHPSCWLSFSGCRTEQTGQAAAELCSPRVAHAGLSTCRTVAPECLVASPLGVEQRMGGMWTILTHLDPSFLQLGFPLDFHLGTISNVSDAQ